VLSILGHAANVLSYGMVRWFRSGILADGKR
jgi:hypothetical protein